MSKESGFVEFLRTPNAERSFWERTKAEDDDDDDDEGGVWTLRSEGVEFWFSGLGFCKGSKMGLEEEGRGRG